MLGRKKVMIVCLLLTYAIIAPVFAYLYFYATEPKYVAAGIILRTYDTPTMQLGFYWDETCTQPVSTFDFGNMTYPNQDTQLYKTIYIRNEGSVWNDIYWNSTLGSVTTQIGECWTRSNDWWGSWIWANNVNGTRIQPNEVLRTGYGVGIPPYATIGTYNWTLTIWGETYY